MALGSKGTLWDVMPRSKSWEPAVFIALVAKIAEGLASLHSKDIIHCDVKPDNMVLNVADTGDVQIWLIDFGDARLLDETSTWCTQGPGAPQIKCQPDNQSGKYSSKTDSWCLAQCAAILWSGNDWVSNPAWLDETMPLYNELSNCLCWNPRDRPESIDVAFAANAALDARGTNVGMEL